MSNEIQGRNHLTPRKDNVLSEICEIDRDTYLDRDI